MKDVSEWKYVNKGEVTFDKSIDSDKESKTYKSKKTDTEDAEGVFYLQRQSPIEVLAVSVPSSEYKTPDVQEGMQDELNKYKMFDAYEVVTDEGQDRIDGR